MNINERERKLLVLLAVVMTIFLIAYLILPKYKNVVKLRSDIEVKNNEISSYKAEELGLQAAYAQKQKTLNELSSSDDDSEEQKINYNLYKEITDGQIVVEINKFIPVSSTDKFVIEEVTFLDNLANDVTNTESDANTSGADTSNTSNTSDTSTTETNDYTEPTPPVDGTNSTNDASSVVATGDGSETQSTDGTTNIDDISQDYNQVLAQYGIEANLTKVVFEGYYGSLIKFVEASDNNDNYVAILSLDVQNVALDDPSLQKNIIRGEMIMAFPTYTGSENISDVYALIDNMYVTSNKDPFSPYDGFVIVDDNFIDNGGSGINNGNGTGTDEPVYKVLESFNKNTYFFVTNDTRNGGYVSNAQKSTDGNASLKLYYDFYNRNNKNTAYAVNQNESIVIETTPQQVLLDIFNDSSNENQFGVVYRDATGTESEVVMQNLDFNGWATCTIPLPDNVVYPIVIQRFFVRSGGSGIKQEGTILMDNLRIIEY